MDDFKALNEYGWKVVASLVLIPWARMAWKKWISGDWTSYNDLKVSTQSNKDRIESLHGIVNTIENEFRKLDKTLVDHLNKEQEEDVRNAKMEVRIDNLQQIMVELKESREKIFSMISDIKNMMIEDRRSRSG